MLLRVGDLHRGVAKGVVRVAVGGVRGEVVRRGRAHVVPRVLDGSSELGEHEKAGEEHGSCARDKTSATAPRATLTKQPLSLELPTPPGPLRHTLHHAASRQNAACASSIPANSAARLVCGHWAPHTAPRALPLGKHQKKESLHSPPPLTQLAGKRSAAPSPRLSRHLQASISVSCPATRARVGR